MKMVMGRPQEYDRKQVAVNLVEWEKKATSINLCGFCTTHDPLLPHVYLSRWAKDDEDFRLAYETAKAFLGNRREQMLNDDLLHVKAYDLNATTYDWFLKDEKRQQAEFESSLKEKENRRTEKAKNPPRKPRLDLAKSASRVPHRAATKERRKTKRNARHRKSKIQKTIHDAELFPLSCVGRV